MMVTVVEVETVGAVQLTEQLPEKRVQLEGAKVPPAESWKLTGPVGTTLGWGPLSWTVTVQVVEVVGGMLSGSHNSATATGLGKTWTEVDPAPPAWMPSPA